MSRGRRSRSPRRRLRRGVTALLVGFSAVAGCGDDPAGPPPDDGVDLDALFRAPSAAEIAGVRAEWDARDPRADDVREELVTPFTVGGAPGTLSVLSHATDAGRHFGIVIRPDGAPPGSLPVVVYGHPGDGGVGVLELDLLLGNLGGLAREIVLVAPSFRDEPVDAGMAIFRSDGPASPWDRDVDDAIALLDAALESVDAADGGRIGAIGFSRGAGVVLLMGVRDPRIDLVVDFFGPTDFFDDFAREIFEEALRGELRDLPGLDVLDERFIQPLAAGVIGIEEVRPELVRRSPVLYADLLPDVQLHHGTDDVVVEVSQAESLVEALLAVGRGAPRDELFIYEGGGHDPLSLEGSVARTVAFLGRLPDGSTR